MLWWPENFQCKKENYIMLNGFSLLLQKKKKSKKKPSNDLLE